MEKVGAKVGANATVNPVLSIRTPDKLRVEIKEASSKCMYAHLLKYNMPKVTSEGKWEAALQIPEEDQQHFWETAYKSAFKAVRETKLQTS